MISNLGRSKPNRWLRVAPLARLWRGSLASMDQVSITQPGAAGWNGRGHHRGATSNVQGCPTFS